MTKWIKRGVPLMIFLLLAFFLARALVENRDTSLVASPLIGKVAPEFALETLNGHAVVADLASHGKMRLVNFFASWCAPCREETPVLLALSKRGDLDIIGIAVTDRPDTLQTFLTQNGDPFSAIGLDRQNRVAFEWGVYGVPETFLVDKNGLIRAKHAGVLTQDIFDQMLQMVSP